MHLFFFMLPINAIDILFNKNIRMLSVNNAYRDLQLEKFKSYSIHDKEQD
jgi:hypothetical protein